MEQVGPERIFMLRYIAPTEEEWNVFDSTIRCMDLRGVPSNLVSRLAQDQV